MPILLLLNPAFLFGLLVVPIPLLIHLFTRRKARKQEFSTVDFIRDIAKRETRRVRVRNILLMILRMAAIAAFVIAMARPALVGPLTRGKGSTSAVVVLDNSASMGWIKDGRSIFNNAGDISRRIFEGLANADDGSLIPICSTGEGVPQGERTGVRPQGERTGSHSATPSASDLAQKVPGLVSGPARLAGMVQLVNLSNGSCPGEGALSSAFSLLSGSKNINKELYIVSDFQRNQWENVELAKQKDIKITLVPLLEPSSRASLENLSVEKAELVPEASPQEQLLEFVVANHGGSEAKGVPVRLLSEGKEIALKYADIGPGSSSRLSEAIAVRLGERTAAEIDIVLPHDSFPLDDTYFLALEPPKQIGVLILGDERSSEARTLDRDNTQAVDFVSLALRPSAAGAAGNLWGFIPHRIATNELSEGELRRAKCVILENVSRLSGRELDLLSEFKSSGGKLLIVLGDRVDIRYYNEKLLPALFPARLVGVEGTPGERAGFFSLVASIASHPILRSFEVSRGQQVSGARFHRLIRAEGTQDSKVIAEFSSGLPAILESRGALLFTSSFDPQWNDLVASGAFLPLLHEMLRYLCGGGPLVGREFYPGEVLEEEIPAEQEGSLSLVGPSGKEMNLSTTRLGASLMIKSEPLDELGVYRLFTGEEELSAYSVNIDPAESRLEPLSTRELLKIFRGASIVSESSRNKLAEVTRSGQELWPLFLVLCIGFLVAELLVARSIVPEAIK